MICGKGISASLPLSAVLGRAEIIELDPSYTSTHGGHALACAASLGNLEAFENENLVSEAKRKRQFFESNWKMEGKISKSHRYGAWEGIFGYL